MNIPSSTTEFVKALLKRVPELQSVYDEHIDDNDEILPHVFLGDVTRYVVHQVRAGATGRSQPAAKILDLFEHALRSKDEDVKELVSVSFLENLSKCNDVVKTLGELIGPILREELDAHDG